MPKEMIEPQVGSLEILKEKLPNMEAVLNEFTPPNVAMLMFTIAYGALVKECFEEDRVILAKRMIELLEPVAADISPEKLN
jgi:hypothetical protein